MDIFSGDDQIQYFMFNMWVGGKGRASGTLYPIYKSNISHDPFLDGARKHHPILRWGLCTILGFVQKKKSKKENEKGLELHTAT